MRIAILDDYQNSALIFADWAKVRARASLHVFTEAFADENEIADSLKDFEVLCLMRERTPFPRSTLARLPNLRHVVLTGRRSQSLDLDFLSERGIGIDFTDTGPAIHATPELAIGLLFAVARNITVGDRMMKSGAWLAGAPLGVVLHGKTLGIVGLGKVGTRVAEVASVLGMRVVAWSPHLTPERAKSANVEFREKSDLLRQADFVSLHLVLGPTTERIIAANELATMKRSAFLINSARGGLVDQPALADALNGEVIAGAGIDVYDPEPLPQHHPLRKCKNIVLLPHFGYATKEIYDVFYQQTAAAVLAYLERTQA